MKYDFEKVIRDPESGCQVIPSIAWKVQLFFILLLPSSGNLIASVLGVCYVLTSHSVSSFHLRLCLCSVSGRFHVTSPEPQWHKMIWYRVLGPATPALPTSPLLHTPHSAWNATSHHFPHCSSISCVRAYTSSLQNQSWVPPGIVKSCSVLQHSRCLLSGIHVML